MIYWDAVIFCLGLQLAMMYCATILAQVTIELSTSLSVHSVELVYQKQHVSKVSPKWKSKTVFRLGSMQMKMC